MPRLHSNAKPRSSRDAGRRSAPRIVIPEKMNRGERLAFSHLMSAAGRKWNAMDSGRRYDLLLHELFPSEATSKLTLKSWRQLAYGHKLLVTILMGKVRGAK